MTVTYTQDRIVPFVDAPETEEAFVPVYARSGRSRRAGGKVRTWMILVPVGAVVLAGTAALLMFGGEETPQPAPAEPAAAAPAAPVASTPVTPPAATPAPVLAPEAPAPAIRAATPERAAPAPARRAEPRAEAPVAARAARPAAPPAPVAPSPETTARTATLNTTPSVTAPTTTLNTTLPAPAQPREPAIIVQPLN